MIDARIFEELDHLMIDTETMGIRPTSAIVSIGACFFNLAGVRASFYTTVNLQSCIDLGLTTDQSTVDWWGKQDLKVREAWDVPDAPALPDALSLLNEFVRKHSAEVRVAPWSNGADFDIPLLKNAYEVLAADPPWRYYNQMCYRTVRHLLPRVGHQRTSPKHHAMYDAVDQAEYLIKTLHAVLGR